MASSERVFAVVLAAGMSKRLGRPKQLLELDGKPLVTHVVERLIQSDVDGVVVVTGYHASEIELELRGYPVYQVFNQDFADGQASSIAAGVRALPSFVDAVVIVLADMPGMRPEVVSAVIDRWRQGQAPAVIARYVSGRGHPVLFDRRVFPELVALTGDEGGRSILTALEDRVVEVPIDRDAPPDDVDTEEDWVRLQTEWS